MSEPETTGRIDRHFILDGHTPVPVDWEGWASWFREDDESRIVAVDSIGETIRVSTGFLGLDHQNGVGPPLLFETMVFHRGLEVKRDLYSTWEEAEGGHRKVVAQVLGEKGINPESDNPRHH